MTKCPRCGSTRTKRSHSKNLKERFLKFFGNRAYRCIKCGWRWSLHVESSRVKQVGKYTVRQIIAIVIFTIVALILIFYWLLHEPDKPETPVQVGHIFSDNEYL